jgi:hypothetical protein
MASGCTSPLSDTPVTDAAKLQVSVDIKHQETNDGYSFAEIVAVLTDRNGRPVNNPSIKLRVNGKDMPLRVSQDLYYGKHPVYQLAAEGEEGLQIEDNTVYSFTMILSDSTARTIGHLKTTPRLLPEQFNFPDSLSRRNGFTLQWHSLPASTKLLVYRMTEATDSTGSLVLSGGPYDPEALKLKTEHSQHTKAKGSWRIPAAYTHIPNGRVTDLGFVAQVILEGEVKEGLLPGSYIRYTNSLERYVPLAD